MTQVAGVILAAGKGTRMHSDEAKVLHPLCGKPLLYYVIQSARQAGIEPIYAVVGYDGEKVQKTFSKENIFWVNQGEQRGTGHALAVTASFLADFNGIILVLCGDAPLVTGELLRKLIDLHKTHKDTAATILSTILPQPNQYGRVIRNETGQVSAIIESAEATPEELQIKEINSGTYVFTASSIYPALKELRPNPKNGEYQLTDVISLLAKKGERIETFIAEDPRECLGINTREELITANGLMEERIQKRLISQGVIIIAPNKTYIEADVTIGAETVIFPFTVIRSGVKIGRHCQVGPFSHLRGGTILDDYAEVGNFTETKKTKLGKHSKAKHLSYLGDAIIGQEVNIGAGTITANYDGKEKHATVIEDGASTGSGTVLVAPVKLGKEAVTGAGAVVTKGNDVPDGVTVVGIPARPLKKKKPPSKKQKS